jgi:hypothetical protein
MATYTYLSLVPESLVVSMLPPPEFSTYLAVGTEKRSAGHAMCFDLKAGFRSDAFDLEAAVARCVPHPDGRPKHSVYAAIYRVLEHVPLDALGSLWLTTRDGRVLELKGTRTVPPLPGPHHLYEEICPVRPRVASILGPAEFARFMTDPRRPMHVPRICFADLALHGLAEDPAGGKADDLPYRHVGHLRQCLTQLDAEKGKHTKTVDRTPPGDFLFNAVHSGFYVGDPTGLLCYPFPSPEDLDRRHHDWWRSANV